MSETYFEEEEQNVQGKMIDILIVGAGPTGLMMAIELKRRGFSVRIIDKDEDRAGQSRAIAIQPRSLEIFEQLGIVDRFLSEGLKVQGLNLIGQNRKLAHIDFSSLPSSYKFILSLEQGKTEKILEDYLASLNVRVERKTELLSFEERGDQVEAMLTTGSLAVSWLIACDGAHSPIRKALGLTFEGKTLHEEFTLADVRIDWTYPHNEGVGFFNSQGFLVTLPLPDPGRYRMIYQSEPTLEKATELLQKYSSVPCQVSDPRWIAKFTINSRTAPRYSTRRVFLVGDAAHIHSPVGGQGMNTGWQDAHNLAWKLDLVHRNKAKKELLDTYDLERRGFGEQLLKGTEIASWIATIHNKIGIFLRNFIVSIVSRIPIIRHKLVYLVSQLGIHYPRSIATKLSGGRRAPNIDIGDTDLYALFQKHQGFFILHSSKKIDLETSFLIEPNSDYQKGLFYVIRPDGYIAMVAHSEKAIRAYFDVLFYERSTPR